MEERSGEDEQGQVVRIGRYEVVRRLSVGGMAELFLCSTPQQNGLRNYVAVKRILPGVRANEQFVQMFRDEARITTALRHPNIPQVYEMGEASNGLFLVMEYIAGRNLNQVLQRCSRLGEALPQGFSTSVCAHLCQALHYAHQFSDGAGKPWGIIHRDVAQKNVMVGYDGAVKLLDFGIAKARNSLAHTHAGMVKGTTGYMSPEQVRGEGLDGRSDLFSVGVMLHELLTGKRLFSAETEIEEMKKVLRGTIAPPHELEPTVPRGLSMVVMKALARDRTERFQTGHEFRAALEEAAGSLLYSQEQRAALMERLFEKKAAEARVLGESTAFLSPAGPVRSSFPTDPVLPSAAVPTAPAVTADGRPRTSFGAGFWARAFVIALAGAAAVLTYQLNFPTRGPARMGESVPAGTTEAPLPGPAESRGRLPEATEVERKAKSTNRTGAQQPGTLTLVTTPPCVVMRGKEVLGISPLFEVSVPAGELLLTLKVPGGQVRLLSVPVQPGRNSAFRVKLEDLPEP